MMRNGRGSLIPLAMLLLAWPVPGRAEDKASAETDQKVYIVLRDVINHGADLYNINQDYAGCYRVYEGALTTLKPFLGHRPELQKAITDGLQAAGKEPVMWRRAFELRKVIDKVRADVRGPGGAGTPGGTATPPVVASALWEKLGGEPGVAKLVDDLVEAAAKDPKVDFWRGLPPPPADRVKALKQSIVNYVSSVTGGPLKYTGKDMAEAHKGMNITGEQFDAFVDHVRLAMAKNVIPADAQKTVLDAVKGTRDKVLGSAKPPTPPTSLWEKLGGEAGVTAVVNDLFETAGKDPTVNFWRGQPPPPADKVKELKQSVVNYISSLTGGPLKYTGKDMVEAHKGLGITNAQFNSFASHLQKAMEKNKVPDEAATTVLGALEKVRKDVVEAKPGAAKPEDGKEPGGDKPPEAKKPDGA